MDTSRNKTESFSMIMFRKIKEQSPEVYKRIENARLYGGTTGNELRGRIFEEFSHIKKREVSKEVWKLLPKAMKEIMPKCHPRWILFINQWKS